MKKVQAFRIDPATMLGPISLAVANLTEMNQFYEEVVGLTVLSESDDFSLLGVGDLPLVRFQLSPEGQQYSEAIGLFHLALLLPTRADLGQWINYFERNHVLRSSADHLYSEAVYINDPEGNVVEVYCDRPRESWYDAAGEVKMGTLPLDLKGIKAEANSGLFHRLPTGTILGHVHLQVRDISESMRFYNSLLGFDKISEKSNAGFVGAGGYHHHIGFNTFHSANGTLPPDSALGLVDFTIKLPSLMALEELVDRLQEATVSIAAEEMKYRISDPSGLKIILTANNQHS